jgi:hypothetical protein
MKLLPAVIAVAAGAVGGRYVYTYVIGNEFLGANVPDSVYQIIAGAIVAVPVYFIAARFV